MRTGNTLVGKKTIGNMTVDTDTTPGAAISPAIATGSVNASKLPVSEAELVEFVKTHYAASEDINDLIAAVLKLLAGKSSKFKYIVNTTTVSAHETSNAQLKSAFGSLWDEKNDGLLNFKFQAGESEWVIFNVIFVSVA